MIVCLFLPHSSFIFVCDLPAIIRRFSLARLLYIRVDFDFKLFYRECCFQSTARMSFKFLAHICLSGITSETIIVFHICFDFIILSLVQNMASSVRVKDETNPVLRLANRADKMTLFCPLGLPRCLPQENSALFPYNCCRSE